MAEPLEDQYFRWLYKQVNNVKTPTFQNKILFSELNRTEFVWLLSGDDNRVQDGLDLRIEFLNRSGLEPEEYWLNEPCSVLEMLIAFSRRAAFETDESPRKWFWEMLDNLGIANLSTPSRDNRRQIRDSLFRFVWRTYSTNGDGGLFPLYHTRSNQKEVEVWYQFSAYLYERTPV